VRKENGPDEGAILSHLVIYLVIPMMAPLDDYRTVTIVIVPAAVQAAIMFVELGARAAKIVTVAIVVAVASDPEPKTFRAGDGWRCNRKGR
jgi:hypothetical protein